MELSEWCGVNAACEKIPKLQAELEKHHQDVFQTDKGASMDMDKEMDMLPLPEEEKVRHVLHSYSSIYIHQA